MERQLEHYEERQDEVHSASVKVSLTKKLKLQKDNSNEHRFMFTLKGL